MQIVSVCVAVVLMGFGFVIGFDFGKSEKSVRYEKAFKVACELLNGGILYGYDTDKIFQEIMKKDGVVCSIDYEEYILNHLDKLTKGI